MMKFNKYLAYLLITTGSIVSCSKSSDPTPSLVGTWDVSTFSLIGCTDGSLNFSDTPCGTLGGGSVLVSCETWVFTATTITVSGSLLGTIVFDYSLSGSTITYKLGGSVVATGTYVVTPTTLSITSDYTNVGAGCKMVETFTKQ